MKTFKEIVIETAKWLLVPVILVLGIPVMLYAFFTSLSGVDGHG